MGSSGPWNSGWQSMLLSLVEHSERAVAAGCPGLRCEGKAPDGASKTLGTLNAPSEEIFMWLWAYSYKIPEVL